MLYCARQAGKLRVFSNFHVHDPYPYDIPAYCGAAVLAAAGRPTQVEFFCLRCTSLPCALRTLPYAPSTSPPPSPRPPLPGPAQVELHFAEKGIMLCKAATMGDFASCDHALQPQVLEAATPGARGDNPVCEWCAAPMYQSVPVPVY